MAVAVEAARLSLDLYHRMIEAGLFADDDRRLEFIEGVIVEMSPRTRAHDDVIAWLAGRLFDQVDRTRHQVRVQSALTLARSEPEPDLFVFALDAERAYHPSSADLVIEVTVSSDRRDLVVKPPIYAGAGIPEYWVVDLDGARVVVHTQPDATGYARIDAVSTGTLRAVHTGVTIDVHALLAPTR